MRLKVILTIMLLGGLLWGSAQVTPEEKQALQDLYNATNGPNWATENDGFIGDEWDFDGNVTNDWYGVTVNNGHVTELDLEFNELSGNIPASIGDLVHLTLLNLAANQLTGSIPNEIGNLSKLQFLDISWNSLSGSIPPELGNLSFLNSLRLQSNSLTATIPQELGDLENLTTLNLASNQLSGSIPQELLSNLTNLLYLTLYGNNLNGSIPSQIQNLTSLEELSLQSNEFTGEIPAELADIQSLTVLRLGGNNLSGPIPSELGNLTNLYELSLVNNLLNGPIPPELGNLSNLFSIRLYSNELSGSIPPELGNLSVSIFDLSNNTLSGSIPAELSNNTNLSYLTLHSNNLSGSIPSELGNLSNLSFLRLNSNQLTGAIPLEIGNLSNLFSLSLQDNMLSGTIPSELGNCSNLEELYLQNNNLSGVIPQEVFGLNLLTTFNIQNNKFDFGNMEFYFQNWFEYILSHNPQQKTDQPEALQVNIGDNINLTTEISGTQNHYQWFKDSDPINGAPDSPNYEIVNASLQDAGVYHCEMTSDIVQGLTLVRHNIELTVDENPNQPEEPEEENWNIITVWDYDMDTNLKGNTRRYYDDLGKYVQTQSWDLPTNTLWAQATLYDYQGRAALSTLSAPMPGQGEFHYHESFITNEGGTAYATADFDMHPLGPDQVFEDGPLGKYYSGITSDQYQDITAYPFSRTIFSELNPGTVLSAVGGNKVDTNGDEQITPADQWPQAYSFTMPATDELSLKVAFGKASYATIQTQKTIVRDVHGNESVVFVDTDGKLLARARSGEEGELSTPMDLYIGAQGYVDVHIPKGVNSGILISNEGAVSLYNLITDAPEPTAAKNLPPGFYRVSVNDKDNYVPNKIFVSYQVNYYDYNLNEYDEAGRLVASYQALTDENDEKLATTYKYNTLGQIVWVSSPDEGTTEFKYRNDGQIRYSQNSKQADDKEVSYTDYDTFGRPVESGVLTQLDFYELNPDKPLPQTDKKETMATTYDFLEDTDLDFLADLDPDHQHPSFLAGNVAKTANNHSTTYYSYDSYGRVKWLVQDIEGLGAKTIDYAYEPLTGLVQKVFYQKGQEDQFVHRYAYNGRDQLVQVETSVDDNDFTVHAKYLYNDAGTLVRTEIADGAQGLDYVYNLSGQLKGINHPSLTPANDPGGDGNDLFGMQLDYHMGDYQRNENSNITTAPQGTDQFNGNIKGIRWQTKINGAQESQYVYSYDRNNWLTGADFAPDANTGDYDVANITYDANGNIQSLVRNKDPNDQNNPTMDHLTYNYDPEKPNRLLWVDDAEGDVPDADDLEDQAPGNYQYNSIGQLTKDVSEGITYIYTASGLVAEVQQNGQPLVKFFYNDRNHRVRKEIYGNGNLIYTIYYVRDVAGQTMAVYNDVGGDPALEEQPIYGAGRIGIAYNGNNNEKTYVYELTDHLGNVRAVFTKAENDANLEGYTDYYPFGMPMPNRTLLGPEGYRYAFQGQEKDLETGKEAFQLRLWDGRIGRWLTTDPYGQYASPYLGMGNNPISMMDPDGGFADGCCDDDWVSNGLNELDGVTMMGMDKSGDMMRGLAGMDFSFSTSLLMSTMIPASAYDYSQETIPGKFEQDWNYILNGAGGNALTRFGDIFSRDWNANTPEQRRDFGVDVTTSIIPGGFIIRGTKTLGKPASKLANKLIKYGKNGRVPIPSPSTANQFKTVSGEIVHIKSGAIYRKSHTTHTGVHGEWKIFTKNSPGFGTQAKKQGHRITTDLLGNIINN